LNFGGLADEGAIFWVARVGFSLRLFFMQLLSLLLFFLPLRQYHAERLCNLLMQLAWKVVPRNDESSKGSEP